MSAMSMFTILLLWVSSGGSNFLKVVENQKRGLFRGYAFFTNTNIGGNWRLNRCFYEIFRGVGRLV